MIPKSIKWRLQLWYGLILVAVLAGLGMIAYQLERGRVFRHLDDDLHKRINVLAVSLHRPPRGQDPNGRPPNHPQPDWMPEDGPPPLLPSRRAPEFHLPAEHAHLFDTNDVNGFFFKIARAIEGDHTVIAQSANYRQPQVGTGQGYDHYFDQLNHVELPHDRKMAPPKSIQAGDDEIVIEMLPSGEAVEVGCSLKPLRDELRGVAIQLAAVSGLILLVGLTGGWWLVTRSLRPISEISSTAAKISAGDLSQRINVAETESELGQLAAVLNATFARLETAFAQQKQFAADAAHELRTPVSVMLTQTQTALNRERDAASYKQTVEACQRAAQRMRKLIESLLELARFDAGQEVLKRLRFDFSKTISESVEMVQTLADERGVKIVSESPELPITGDSERLAQVVANLLTNAIQYNKSGGEVRVKLASPNGLAVLTVADTGQGIAPENLPQVFTRFFRADTSRTGAGNTGLGLSICKAIVEAHGGTIEAASEAGKGSTFTVRLPV